MKRRSVTATLARGWLVWVTIAVVGLAAFAVVRLQDAFGAQDPSTPAGMADEVVPFDPKQVQIEVFGDPGATATITYSDVNSRPQRVDATSLPWSYQDSTTTPAVVVNVQAQSDGYNLSCRITVDGVVKVESAVSRPGAYVFCLDKSG